MVAHHLHTHLPVGRRAIGAEGLLAAGEREQRAAERPERSERPERRERPERAARVESHADHPFSPYARARLWLCVG
ncbi:MAG: hypothetical protein FJ138_06555 [Deltaproteobacteria bacterium]|nr:hypothetical protein [Deltaproteobacteria bacterium]